jgi:uncharacterized coiled-coil protein SlyX
MTVSEKIANTLQDVEANPDALLVSEVLEKLKDMDAQRIAKDDSAIIRKGVLALVPVLAELEARIARLESALAASEAK